MDHGMIQRRGERRWRGAASRLVLASLALLTACGQVTDRISGAAEATRSATEKMAQTSKAEAKKREVKIEALAEPAREKNALVVGDRFILRPEGTGWAVVDLSTGEPASIAGAKLSDLDLAAAQKALDDIHADLRNRANAK